ncbi:DgyrCDS10423 [Dimorphilus gyrociliatus]|uniref:DgyrCDS10423 n=1 Tax=Dimorphilus gyrociliatus TaxID=2664684 RepID=A0A7I8W1C4_9ANNE|nr:DgyrCDS10423 [Dimorphilus gyrociliatus]
MDKLNNTRYSDHYIFEESPIIHDQNMKRSKTKSLLNITEKLGFKKKTKKTKGIELPTGRLVTVHGDGSHQVELRRPMGQPFGFYIAQGNQKTNGGLFISRISQNIPQTTFDGLLNLGDEILMINNIPIKRMNIDDVYDIFGREFSIDLRLLPYSSRKENVL